LTGGQEDRRTGGQEDRRTGGQEDRGTGGQGDRGTLILLLSSLIFASILPNVQVLEMVMRSLIMAILI
jgi:hypothetical protein